MFYGRKQELVKLENLYSSNKFEMAVIYGRRRVGKTTLINEFCKNKKTIFFSAIESSAEKNLEIFSAEIFSDTIFNIESSPKFNNFDKVFDSIAQIAKHERTILVIDEYPYLASSDKSISSLLQSKIDHKFLNTKLFIILCGSSMSFMEKQVLGYASPLYGRRTAQFKILPFDYFETSRWVPNYTNEEKAIVYGITGGVPLYINLFNDDISLEKNIMDNVFDQNALLFEEPSNLLKQELREPQTYNAIITAISNGSSRLNEIASKVGIETGLCTKYLTNLILLGIIIKETPITEKMGKKTIYLVSDNLFRFWHKFVQKNMAAIVSNRKDAIYINSVKPQLSEYMGLIFEKMCKDYLLFYYNSLPVEVGQIGQWWGNHTIKRKQAQIDIVLISPDNNSALFGECKFREEPMKVKVLEQLIENASVLKQFPNKYYCLFSKSGFTKALIDKAKKDSIILIDLKQMYEY